MSANSKQLLKDPNNIPTNEIIADGLGNAANLYDKFLKELKQYDITLMDWRYYNDGKAWLSKGEYKWITSRGTQKVKPIFWLSIWEGFFKVSFYFSEKTRENLLLLPISKSSKDLIKSTQPTGKKMQFLAIIFDVSIEEQLHDIYVISEFRKNNI